MPIKSFQIIYVYNLIFTLINSILLNVIEDNPFTNSTIITSITLDIIIATSKS